MDPRKCLLDAAATLDPEEALDRLEDYFAWRGKGGYEPMIGTMPGDLFAHDLRIDLWKRIA